MKRKKKKPNKKNERKKKLIELQNKVKTYGYLLWDVPQNKKWQSKETNSWFDYETISNKPNSQVNINIPKADNKNDQPIKCKFVTLKPTEEQRKILLGWLEGCRLMYNYTLKYIRNQEYEKLDRIVRSGIKLKKILKDYKDKIAKEYNVPTHILDEAVKEVCSNYKSAFENLKLGNIKHFHIRYIRRSNKTFIAKIENQYFSKKYSTISPTILGKKLNTYENYDLKQITKMAKPGSENLKSGGITCTLHYNKDTNRFRLYIPTYINRTNLETNNYVAIDPGIRTFLTGYGKKRAFKLCSNYKDLVGKCLDKINKIKSEEANIKQIKKVEKRMNRKIDGYVSELHWKSINILTKKYDTIIIGKWSTKEIVNNKTSVLAKKTKVLAQRTNFFKFLTRLQYKCDLKGINLKITEESYTSRTCSNCSYENRNIKGNKEIKCGGCKIKINRDINGARNILLKVL